MAEEKKAAEALAAKFKVDLGAAMSPAQALDVWLTLLTDLRRPSDADPALAATAKVLSTSPGESEDAAKARTVAGLAHFLKGDMNKAREMFAAAKASPAYRPTAGKPWAARRTWACRRSTTHWPLCAGRSNRERSTPVPRHATSTPG